jgi:hypothetical protein
MAVLIAVTLANLAWTFREPLLEVPYLRNQLVRMGILETPIRKPFREPGMIHLVSRDLHEHPTRTGILVLSATFVSRSSQAQAWPSLELTLHDPSNRPLAMRRFKPSEYLGWKPGPAELLEPETHVPVLLEFADPGALATGFEVQFH